MSRSVFDLLPEENLLQCAVGWNPVSLAFQDKGKPSEKTGRKATGPWVSRVIRDHLRIAELPREKAVSEQVSLAV